MAAYPHAPLYLDGEFVRGGGRREQEVINPADNTVIGYLTHATPADLDQALASAQRAFENWRQVSPLERAAILRAVAAFTRERVEAIARNITLDQGKPLAEARAEVLSCVDHIEWHADEARRIYGRVIPARQANLRQLVVRQPVGVCVAFTPWNFPLLQAVRKVVAALASGCTVILKGPEDAPSAVTAMVRMFHDAGLPPGCLSSVWGVPAEVSEHLIASPITRKLSFTGSVAVGKHLAALAGGRMKRMTLELGGHSPVLVFDDADVDRAADVLAAYKSRNAGQVCIAPSRFYVQRGVFHRFVDRFVERYGAQQLGNGLSADTTMGPLAHARRVDAMDAFMDDARSRGAAVLLGGQRAPRSGNFYPPSVVTGLDDEASLLKDEIFGPIVPIVPFDDMEEGLRRANGTEYGLASYLFTSSLHRVQQVSERLEAGCVNVNHFGLGFAEVPLGGVKDSGIGSEGGAEALDAYLVTKLVSEASVPAR